MLRIDFYICDKQGPTNNELRCGAHRIFICTPLLGQTSPFATLVQYLQRLNDAWLVEFKRSLLHKAFIQ